MKKRAIGITLVCIALLWLTISGAGNAYFILSGQTPNVPTYIGILILLYAIIAFLSSIGIWMMKKWGLYLFRAWIILCLIVLVAMTYAFDYIYLVGTPGILGFSVIVICLFWILNKYVSSQIDPENYLATPDK